MNDRNDISERELDELGDLPDSTEERLKTEGSRLSVNELEDVESRLRLRSAIVYEIIRQEGEEELERTASSLWWSGIAAGLSIGFSVVAEGLFRTYLPDALWRPLIDNLGYSVGFVIVILARQQLFTENTITVVLPLVAQRTMANLTGLARLWSIVFLANMVGTAIFGLALSSNLFFPAEVQQSFRDIAEHLLALPVTDVFLRGIVAGWIIATLVWLLPSAGSMSVPLIVLLTYLIALGDLAHVIAGSVEAFMLAFDGTVGWSAAVVGFILPALIGNIIGGSALFALISYAQVKEEI